MFYSLHLSNAVSTVAEVHRLVVGTEIKVSTHAGSEIDDDIHIAAANALHHFGIEFYPPARLATIRLPYMNVGNRSAGFCSLDRRRRNFLRCDRNLGMLANCIPRAGYRTANNNNCDSSADPFPTC